MQTAAMIRATPVFTKASAPRAARTQTVVRAMDESTTRRAALAMAAAAVIGFSVVDTADAVSAPKNASTATQDGYTMEGTKKMGISAKKRNKILSTVREKALAASAKASAKIKAAAPAE